LFFPQDFAGVWPIFDAAQSRDFRKVKQYSSSQMDLQHSLYTHTLLQFWMQLELLLLLLLLLIVSGPQFVSDISFDPLEVY
jgi:hypothetical protein